MLFNVQRMEMGLEEHDNAALRLVLIEVLRSRAKQHTATAPTGWF
jgi:hypothetical protein